MKVFTKNEIWKKYCGFMFSGLFFLAVVLSVSYVYFMNLMVIQIADGKKDLSSLNEIKGEIREMETIYMRQIDDLDISRAKDLGFVEAEPSLYAYRQGSVAQANGNVQNFR
ncbi:MAG: hypothetical protein PHC85_00755 [Candidatus Pacebacteria bacterium]|nr:hypothetical protein [Candidatus Paceibacterota bacterium]